MEENTTQESTPSPVEEKKSNKKLITVIIVVVVVLFLANSFFSPERVAENMMENMIERASDGKVDVDMDRDGNMMFETEDGDKIEVSGGGKEVKLPDTWPNDVAIMDGARLDYSGEISTGDGNKSQTVTYSVDGSPASVTAFYTSSLKDKGWTIGTTMATSEGSMIIATMGETSTVTVYIGQNEEGKTSVSISSSKAKN